MKEPSYSIDVRPILEDLGETIDLDVVIPLPTLVVGYEEFVPRAGAQLTGTLTNTGAGVVLLAQARVPLQAECSRCLREFELQVEVNVDGFYVAHGAEAGLPEEQEVAFIEGGSVDIMGAIVSAVALELPFAPLHDENCLGICPVCGADRNESPCNCELDSAESPFAVLRGLFPPEE